MFFYFISYFCVMKRMMLFFAIFLFQTMAVWTRDFHATPDMDTGALQALIDRASSIGGGRVVFCKGRFFIGQLELKSGVELHLEEGACLLGSTSPYDYVAVEANITAGDRLKDNSHKGLMWHPGQLHRGCALGGHPFILDVRRKAWPTCLYGEKVMCLSRWANILSSPCSVNCRHGDFISVTYGASH